MSLDWKRLSFTWTVWTFLINTEVYTMHRRKTKMLRYLHDED